MADKTGFSIMSAWPRTRVDQINQTHNTHNLLSIKTMDMVPRIIISNFVNYVITQRVVSFSNHKFENFASSSRPRNQLGREP